MKVSQKVRRLSENRHSNGEPQWIEDEIYPDVDLEKAYVGRVSSCLIATRQCISSNKLIQVPIMVRSDFCITNNVSTDTLYEIGECPLDMVSIAAACLHRVALTSTVHIQGGYFIVNGSEKVLIAQERMAGNFLYVFAKAQPSAASHTAEITSVLEGGGRVKLSKMIIKLLNGNADRGVRPRFSTRLTFVGSYYIALKCRRTMSCARPYLMSVRIFPSCLSFAVLAFFRTRRS